MKNKITVILFLLISFTATSRASAPQLGEWQLLFDNDDGRAVAIDVYRETPVILDKEGHIYFLNKEIGKEATGDWFGEVYENWQKVSGGGEAMDISIDDDGVPWVVGLKSNKIYHLDGDFAGSNRGWIEYPGNGKAKRISVSRENRTPYIIGAVSGRIFKGENNGWTALDEKLLDSSGKEISGTLNALDLYAMSYNAVGNDKPEWHDLVFAINQDKRVFLHVPAKKAWLELPGNARASAVVASGKLVYIIGEDNKFYGLDLSDGKQWDTAGTGTGKDLAYSQVNIFQPFIRQNGKSIPYSTYRYIWTIGDKGRVYRAFVAY